MRWWVFTFPFRPTNHNDFRGSIETEPLFEMTAQYGIPYFQELHESTFRPTWCDPVLPSPARPPRTLKRGNGLFGSTEMTGSIGVVTVNMARIGYLARATRTDSFSASDTLWVREGMLS